MAQILLYRALIYGVQPSPLYPILNKGYLVAKPKTKDVLEMLGEFFRDAAVLVTVFFPLDFALKGEGNLSLPFLILICCLSLLCLLMGISLEKLRER